MEVADKTELISAAPTTYAKRSRQLLEAQNVDKLLEQVAQIETRVNVKVRDELKDIGATVESYSPVCMEPLDEEDMQDFDKLNKKKEGLKEEFDQFEKDFPQIEKWLKDFHAGIYLFFWVQIY